VVLNNDEQPLDKPLNIAPTAGKAEAANKVEVEMGVIKSDPVHETVEIEESHEFD